MKKIGIIAQARMTSSRLPGKVMKDIQGEPALWHVIQRMKMNRHNLPIIIATTTNATDDIVEETAKNCGVDVFRGSEFNVLSRYYYAAKEFGLDALIRVTCDQLLFDPTWILDDMVDAYLADPDKYDVMISGFVDEKTGEFKSYEPQSGGCAIFTFAALEKTFKETTNPYCIEHVGPYMLENPQIFRTGYMHRAEDRDYSNYEVSLDTQADLDLIRRIYDDLYPQNHKFSIMDVVDWFDNHPDALVEAENMARTPVTYHGEESK